MGHQQSPRPRPLLGIGLVNLATITWATNMILGRYLRDQIGPLSLAASRFLVASLLFAMLLGRRAHAGCAAECSAQPAQRVTRPSRGPAPGGD